MKFDNLRRKSTWQRVARACKAHGEDLDSFQPRLVAACLLNTFHLITLPFKNHHFLIFAYSFSAANNGNMREALSKQLSFPEVAIRAIFMNFGAAFNFIENARGDRQHQALAR